MVSELMRALYVRVEETPRRTGYIVACQECAYTVCAGTLDGVGVGLWPYPWIGIPGAESVSSMPFPGALEHYL